MFKCKSKNKLGGKGGIARETHTSLHKYLKERQEDVKFTQALLGALPKENMQMYFHERNADTEYQP